MTTVLTCTDAHDALRLLGGWGGQDTRHLGGGCGARRCFWRRSIGPCSTLHKRIQHPPQLAQNSLVRAGLAPRCPRRAPDAAGETREDAPRGGAHRSCVAGARRGAVASPRRRGSAPDCWTRVVGWSQPQEREGCEARGVLGAALGAPQVPHMALGGVSTFKSFPLTSECFTAQR